MARNYEQGFEDGKSVGYEQGLSEGYKDGFAVEYSAHEAYVDEIDKEIDELYDAFAQEFQKLLVRIHGQQEGTPKQVRRHLMYYVPNLNDRVDVDRLIDGIK